MSKIVVVGTGLMTAEATRRLAPRLGAQDELVLADRRREAAQELATALQAAPPAVSAVELDLFDAAGLARVVRGAGLVLLGAGPFLRTAGPVLDACITAGCDLLDIADDTEAADLALAREADARHAGVCVSIGCGASPGLTSVLAADAADALDEVHELDLGWVVGDEGPQEMGTAVLEHWLHCVAGDTTWWIDGARAELPGFSRSTVLPFGAPLGPTRVWACPHPEPVTLARRHPDARAIRLWGALDPAPVNGLSKGVGAAVRTGRLDAERAVGFFRDVLAGRAGDLRVWRHALAGVGRQVRHEGLPAGEALRWLAEEALSRRRPVRSGVVAVARGTRDGRPATTVRRSTGQAVLGRMDVATGGAAAAFALLALETRTPGVRAPEDWVGLDALRAALHRVGLDGDAAFEGYDEPPVTSASAASVRT